MLASATRLLMLMAESRFGKLCLGLYCEQLPSLFKVVIDNSPVKLAVAYAPLDKLLYACESRQVLSLVSATDDTTLVGGCVEVMPALAMRVAEAGRWCCGCAVRWIRPRSRRSSTRGRSLRFGQVHFGTFHLTLLQAE